MAGLAQVRQRARSIYGSLRARVTEDRVPSWILGTLVTLLAWRPAFLPPEPGLDPSWHTGLAMAAHRGLDFGTEVIFTFGPLGFLDYPGLWYQDLAVIAFCYAAALYVSLAIALVWALRRAVSTAVAVAVAYLLLALLPGIDQPVALAAILCVGMLQRGEPPMGTNLFVAVAASLAAVEAVLKISIGPLILAMALIALIGLRARRWQISALIGLFVAEVVLIWLVTGQNLADLPDFVRNSKEIVSGYNEAMAFRDTSSFSSLVTVLIPLSVIGAASLGAYRDAFAKRAAVVLFAVTAFVLFKHGVVRFGPNHVAIWVSTAALLWIAIPWDATRAASLIAGAAVLSAMAIHEVPSLARAPDPIGGLKLARQQLENLVVPSRRRALEDGGRGSMQAAYGLEPQTLAALRGHSVSIDPWEIGVAWAYDLDWSPLPVFQNYSAYTERLDELNAEAVADPGGPERILRENKTLDPGYPSGSIDSRYPAWDPPAQARATLCNFRPLSTTERWQVLARVPDRCGAPRAIESVEAGFDEPVEVPAPGPREVVFVRIEGAGIGGFERIWAALWRPRSRYAIVNDSTSYRLVPGTAEDGLMLRASDGVAGEGAFAQVPQARTIELTGAGGELRYDFFRFRVQAATG